MVPGFIGKYSLSMVVVNSAGLMWGLYALFSSCGVELAHPAKSMITNPTIALNTAFCPIVVNHPFPREPHFATFLAHPTLRPPKRSTVSVSLRSEEHTSELQSRQY